MRKFAYDVGVHLLANLVAAAVIYLTAVGGGYVKKNPPLLVGSVGVLGVSALLALAILIGRIAVRRGVPEETVRRTIITVGLLLGFACLALALFGGYLGL